MVTPDVLWYEFTMEDPKLFSAPWSGAFSMRKTNERIFEDACHEGSYATGNVLRGARVQEGAAVEKEIRIAIGASVSFLPDVAHH